MTVSAYPVSKDHGLPDLDAMVVVEVTVTGKEPGSAQATKKCYRVVAERTLWYGANRGERELIIREAVHATANSREESPRQVD